MKLTKVVKIYPNKAQKEMLYRNLAATEYVQGHFADWKNSRQVLFALRKLKRNHPKLAGVDENVLINAYMNWQKGQRSHRLFAYSAKYVQVNPSRITLPDVDGSIRYRGSERQYRGKFVACYIVLKGRQWFAHLVYEVKEPVKKLKPTGEKAIIRVSSSGITVNDEPIRVPKTRNQAHAVTLRLVKQFDEIELYYTGKKGYLIFDRFVEMLEYKSKMYGRKFWKSYLPKNKKPEPVAVFHVGKTWVSVGEQVHHGLINRSTVLREIKHAKKAVIFLSPGYRKSTVQKIEAECSRMGVPVTVVNLISRR